MNEEIKENIESIKIEEEMQGAYLEYAMSVIAGRALPDVRDGLKPVHRRILYAMYDMGNTYDKRYLKSARIVGDVIGKYHPHGDSAVYNAMVRMAQSFSQRYELVDGQGNFGSIDGDSAAAMRYTESRMSRFGGQLLEDIDKETVEFGPNYDGSLLEPKVLPTRVPNLLLNGADGIAVGMSTKIPPHNIGEVIQGTIALIDNPEIGIDELMKIIPGPDLPTGGILSNISGIRSAYRSGRGSFVIRGKATIENTGKDKEAIVVSEIPYQVNKSTWISSVAELVRNKEIEGITDIRDESDRKGIRVVIELRRGEPAQLVLNNLYAKTQLQISFGIIMLAIENGRPKLFNLKEMLQAFIHHRKDVVTRRCVFELKKAEARAHILEGLKIALENIDAVVELIKKAPGPLEAKDGLCSHFGLSEKQAQAILEMRLQRLTALETQKLLDELQEVLSEIQKLKFILSHDYELFRVIKEELENVLKIFNDKRRSEISIEEIDNFDAEDFVKNEQVVVTISNSGYAKRNSVETYKSQGRGGKGIRGAGTGTEDNQDFISHVFVANTLSYILCFSNYGRLYWLKVHQIPEMNRTARGRPLVQILQLGAGEKILSLVPVEEFVENKYVVMLTKRGIIKKTDLMSFSNIRQSGVIAMNFDEGDELIGAAISDGNNEIFIATKKGQSIRFSEADVRSMGRTARGVRAITLSDDDQVVAMEILPAENFQEKVDYTLLSVTSRGYGKRTPLKEYRTQGRGGSGIINLRVGDKVGDVVTVKKVRQVDDVMIMSRQGQMIRISTDSVSEIGRATQGVRLIHLEEQDIVNGVAIISEGSISESSGEDVLN